MKIFLPLLAVAVMAAACGADDSARDSDATTSAPSSTTTASTTSSPTTTPATQPPGSGDDSGSSGEEIEGSDGTLGHEGEIAADLQPTIDQAVADLAERLSASLAGIKIVSARHVTWPNAALGCPEPGTFYAQVLVEGSLIELEHEGTFYRYHAGDGTDPFPCLPPGVEEPPVGELDPASFGY